MRSTVCSNARANAPQIFEGVAANLFAAAAQAQRAASPLLQRLSGRDMGPNPITNVSPPFMFLGEDPTAYVTRYQAVCLFRVSTPLELCKFKHASESLSFKLSSSVAQSISARPQSVTRNMLSVDKSACCSQPIWCCAPRLGLSHWLRLWCVDLWHIILSHQTQNISIVRGSLYSRRMRVLMWAPVGSQPSTM